MDISACIIARNEEENIARCLKSIQPYCDQIIVVDTGSTDHTPDIAISYGANLYHLPWPNSFALARNYALEQAQKNWILSIDCDEVLCSVSKKVLRQLLTEKRVLGYGIVVSNIINGSESYATLSPRLFKNLPHLRYKGAIHENLVDTHTNTVPEGHFLRSSLKFLHYGYETDPHLESLKSERNLSLLLSIPPNERDALYYLHLGAEYLRLNNLTLASSYFEQGIILATPDLPCYTLLAHKLVSTLIQEKLFEKALAYIIPILNIFPDFKCLHFLKTICHIELKQFDLALTHLKLYTSIPHGATKYPSVYFENTNNLEELEFFIRTHLDSTNTR